MNRPEKEKYVCQESPPGPVRLGWTYQELENSGRHSSRFHGNTQAPSPRQYAV
jgi:hypothetical protein